MKVKYTVINRSCWFLAGVTIVIAYCWLIGGIEYFWNPQHFQKESESNKNIVNQIEKHTQIINGIGVSARTSGEVTDLLLRVRHYTDSHGETKHVLCPECSKDDPKKAGLFTIEDHEHPDEPEEVPETTEQVMKDLEEINRGVGSIDVGHRHQIIFLQILLKDLEENKNLPLLRDLQFFGGAIDDDIVVR